MAVTKLTNEQIHTLVNAAYKQAIGGEGVDVQLDLTKFTDVGTGDPTMLREKFTGALVGVITKNWFLDSSYRSSYTDVFFEDSARFGAITQAISIEAPEVKENSAWKDFQSGVTTVGQYTVYLPVVETQFYTKSESYALPITITGEQWDTAFRDESSLYDFVGYVFMVVDNAIVQHMEDLNALNRNNFLAEKIQADVDNVAGIHVIDLVKAYCEDRGIEQSMTVATFLSTKDCLLYAIEQIKLYMGYLKKQTKLFNTAGKTRFVPADRMVVQLLSFFEERLYSVALSSTFHDDMVALPYHSSVAAWQSMEDLSFDGISSINVKIKNASGQTKQVEKGGIVGFICDKWAIIHTMRSNRVATQRFDIENLTHYEYQFRDSYMNNLTMNAVVFCLSDYVQE